MRWIFVALLVCIGSLTRADVIVPVKTVRANTLLTLDMLTTKPLAQQHGLTVFDDVIGMESRVVLYAGRPIRAEDLIEPAIVQRNQIVPLLFNNVGLSISTYGRVLDRGAAGDIVRVMNLASRTTLFGQVQENGSVRVDR